MNEHIDLQVLSSLFSKFLSRPVVIKSTERSSLGNGQETWFVQTVDGDKYVLRRTAAAGPLEWTDRESEYEVLQQLHALGLPVPRVHWFEPQGGLLERSYFVMDEMPGKPPRQNVSEHHMFQLGVILAKLHTQTKTQEQPVSAQAHFSQLLVKVRARYSEHFLALDPLSATLLVWLEQNLPVEEFLPVRLWGDPGPHNFLVEGDTISALLDWEMSSVGHPMEDLGSAFWSCMGFVETSVVRNGYESITGSINISTLRWCEVLAHIIRAGQARDGMHQFVIGRSNDPILPAMGLALVSANLLRAARAAWDTIPITHSTNSDNLDTAAPKDLLNAIERCIANLNSITNQDRWTLNRLKIAEAVLLGLHNGCSQVSLTQLSASLEIGTAEIGGILETCCRLESFGESAELKPHRQILVDQYSRQRDLMEPLLSYFGKTTSTSVAK